MHIFDLTRILRRGGRHQAGHGESVFVSVGIMRVHSACSTRGVGRPSGLTSTTRSNALNAVWNAQLVGSSLPNGLRSAITASMISRLVQGNSIFARASGVHHALSLPKTRFEHSDGVVRQGLDARQCLRTVRRAVCRAHPYRAKL